TGAPKIRAIEIIAELEPSARGVYCGAIGYWSATGELDTSVAIRTAVARDGRVYLNAGGGIVADSDPEQEYRETLDKARGLIDALVASARPTAATSCAPAGPCTDGRRPLRMTAPACWRICRRRFRRRAITRSSSRAHRCRHAFA